MSEDSTESYIDPIPLMSEDLIKQLAKDIPPVRISPSDTLAKLMYMGAQRELVDTLLDRLNATNIQQLEGDISVNV